ncbi:hypothetical protein A0H81_08152 [Grifola frondosa]|uniref:Uncharacterized protein n=1 Tax=Grifola frondosa TaxID=5627 RepID=A0A1C7M6G9_GRIFR|nr:hypothetical protein A0H81_08152 [Grifola frondosa]
MGPLFWERESCLETLSGCRCVLRLDHRDHDVLRSAHSLRSHLSASEFHILLFPCVTQSPTRSYIPFSSAARHLRTPPWMPLVRLHLGLQEFSPYPHDVGHFKWTPRTITSIGSVLRATSRYSDPCYLQFRIAVDLGCFAELRSSGRLLDRASEHVPLAAMALNAYSRDRLRIG